jgi:hypothetical protein
MSVIVSSNLVLTADEAALSADHPIIGWQTIITASNITFQSTSDANYPESNLANPATHLAWRAAAASGGYTYFSIATGTADPLDYVAIARHNLGTIASSVTVGYFDTSSPPAFVALTPETLLADDGPALFRFTAQSLATNIAVRLGASAVAPQIAVMFAGKLLVLPRKIYQGLAPINYARVAKVTNGRSEAGQFLGRIVMQEFVKNTIPLSLIGPTYFRDHIAEFLVSSKTNPFFFAWRPGTYPAEIGYCHMTNDPLPVNEAPHGLVAMSMEMTGVV